MIKISKVPKIPLLKKELVREILKGNVIAFIGAGFSMVGGDRLG
ncbi:hypothetical protein AAIR98_001481 [Elusimicrobium simillimum]